MLEELKSKFYSGNKGELIYFLSEIIGKKTPTVKTIKKHCEYSSYISSTNVDALTTFSAYLRFIEIENEKVSLTSEFKSLIADKVLLNQMISEKILKKLMELVPNPNLFHYDIAEHAYRIRNELIPLALGIFRDVLVSLAVFIIKRDDSKTYFLLSESYEDILANAIAETPRKITLEQLLKTLELQAEMGREAELLVMRFETKRLEGKLPKRISEVDVAAGFDIMSYDSINSITFDRFIEVKAVGKSLTFHWTSNEIAKANLLGNQYWLYLVDIQKAKSDEFYEPFVIQNPDSTIVSPSWLRESESFIVRRLDEF